MSDTQFDPREHHWSLGVTLNAEKYQLPDFKALLIDNLFSLTMRTAAYSVSVKYQNLFMLHYWLVIRSRYCTLLPRVTGNSIMDISISQLSENSSGSEDVEWGSFDDLFDQSFSNFASQQIGWAGLNPGKLNDAPTNHYAAGHISGLLVDRSSPRLDQSNSNSRSLLATTTKPKPKRGRKGGRSSPACRWVGWD
jgi:hypothetical protein